MNGLAALDTKRTKDAKNTKHNMFPSETELIFVPVVSFVSVV
jgi:hypothetical protein